MKKEDIIKFAQSKGDPEITKNLIKNFDIIKESPEISAQCIQLVFGETKKLIKDMLIRGSEDDYKVNVACIVDEVIDYMNLIGEEEVAQMLQRVYENLFTDLIAERMWKIARDTTYPTKAN